MKNPKAAYVGIIVASLAISAFLISKAFKKPKPEPKPIPEPGGPGGSGFPAQPTSEFPLSRGSKGAKVVELQTAIISSRPDLLKPPADGSFGPNTEAAVKAIIGKGAVENQTELDSIKKMKSAADATANRKALAGRVVSAWQANRNLKIQVNQKTSATIGKTDLIGRDYDVKTIILNEGQVFQAGLLIKSMKVQSNGMLLATFPDNSWASFSPYAINLIK